MALFPKSAFPIFARSDFKTDCHTNNAAGLGGFKALLKLPLDLFLKLLLLYQRLATFLTEESTH